MTQTIHKYPISPESNQEIILPLGAKILHVGCDPAGDPALWAQIDVDIAPNTRRIFWMFGTGHPMPNHHPRLTHLGSFLYKDGIFHFYEEVA